MLYLAALVTALALAPSPAPALLVDGETTCEYLMIGAYNDGPVPVRVSAYDESSEPVTAPFVLAPGEQQPIAVSGYPGLRVRVQADGADVRQFTWAPPGACADLVPLPAEPGRPDLRIQIVLGTVAVLVLTLALTGLGTVLVLAGTARRRRRLGQVRGPAVRPGDHRWQKMPMDRADGGTGARHRGR
jgi:hypothetical protein